MDGFDRRKAIAALGTASLITVASREAIAATDNDAPRFAAAVERLRIAMLEGDSAVLAGMLHDDLVYMHSSGHSQSKADVLRDLAGKTFFASLVYPEIGLKTADKTGIAVMTVDQVKNLPGGKTRASRIKVLQTWISSHGTWKLLARSSAMMVSAASVRPASAAPANPSTSTAAPVQPQ